MAKSIQPKSKPKSGQNRLTNLTVGLWISVIGMLIYGNTLGHQYTLDDFSVIKDNFVTKKGLEGIGTILTTDYRYGYWISGGTLYRPLSLIMFAIEWSFAPDSPFVGHLLNVLLFGLSIFVLFLLLKNYIAQSSIWLTAAICLLFATHPIHTEVVANIKSRDEILGLLGCLLALLFFLKSFSRNSMLNLGLAFLFYTIAMFSKESAITFLAIFPLTAYFFTDSSFSKIFKKSLVLLVPAIFFLIVRQKVIGGNISLDQTSILDNFIVGSKDPITKLASAVMMLGYYLKSFLLPVSLCHEYGYNQIPLSEFGDWRFLISLLIHLAMGIFIIKSWKQKSLEAYGLLFYLITMSVVSNVIITIGTSYGERLYYVPSLGLIIFITAYAFRILQKNALPVSMNQLSQGFKWPVLIIALLFSLKTISRNYAWFDSYTLYSTDVETSPNSAKLRYHYALELGKKAMPETDVNKQREWRLKAIEQDLKSLQIYPNYNDPYSHLGLMHYHLKEYPKAVEYYKKAIAFGDNDPKTFSNMGTLYSEMGERSLAMEQYKKAVTLDPRFVDARRNLGCLMAMDGQFSNAIKEFEEALKYDPNNADILYFMGSAYRDGGNNSKGQEYLEQAYNLKPELRK